MQFFKRHHISKLRRFNNFLSLVVVAMCFYAFAFPYLPQISFWWGNVTNSQPPLVAAQNTERESHPQLNTLVIPSLNLQEVIYEGNTEAVLDNGVWRRPMTSSPEKGSNTALAGHRFDHRGGSVFYHLDKIRMNNKLIVYWEDKKYTYKVDRIQEVPPSAVAIEAPTEENRLTLYTCTPLWTAKNRLVVSARLEEVR